MSDSWNKLRSAKEYGYFNKKNKKALEKIKKQVCQDESKETKSLPEIEIERTAPAKEDWQGVDAVVAESDKQDETTPADWKDFFRYEI